MRQVLIVTTMIFMVICSYALGYKKGGEDSVYFQKLTDGMITSTVMEARNAGKISPEVVFSYVNYSIARALWSYIERSENVSVLGPYLISGYSQEIVERSLEHIVNYHKTYGYEIGCDKTSEANKDYAMSKDKCYELQGKVNAIMSLHSNKSLKVAP